jgi:hypothetical protein
MFEPIRDARFRWLRFDLNYIHLRRNLDVDQGIEPYVLRH